MQLNDAPSPPASEALVAPALAATKDSLGRQGFAKLSAAVMKAALCERGFENWEEVAASWDQLSPDRYMADGGRYRRRRFCAYSVSREEIRCKPPQPHYQSRDFNPLNGGVERWFEPVHPDVAKHPAITAIIRTCDDLFRSLTDAAPLFWHVELHQFRIEAQAGLDGQPTPEGLHRDGVDWVLMLLVRRENVRGGETQIVALQGQPLGQFTLVHPLEAAFVDDARVSHGVTPIQPEIGTQSAYRDVLVVTFRR